MSALRPRTLLGLLLVLPGVALASAPDAERPRLRFDPFVRPDLSVAAASDPAAGREGQWSPVLNATLVAGDRSLANLGGVVLGIGEETHGYRLVEVRAWEAVFEHGGERTVLPVKAREEEN